MTPSDRANMAQIVAYGMAQGESRATMEARLYQYAPAASQADIDRAVASGALARAAAGELQFPRHPGSDTALGSADIAEHSQVRALIWFNVRPGDEWIRTASVELPADATADQLRAEARRVITRKMQEEYEEDVGAALASMNWVMVAPHR